MHGVGPGGDAGLQRQPAGPFALHFDYAELPRRSSPPRAPDRAVSMVKLSAVLKPKRNGMVTATSFSIGAREYKSRFQTLAKQLVENGHAAIADNRYQRVNPLLVQSPRAVRRIGRPPRSCHLLSTASHVERIDPRGLPEHAGRGRDPGFRHQTCGVRLTRTPPSAYFSGLEHDRRNHHGCRPLPSPAQPPKGYAPVTTAFIPGINPLPTIQSDASSFRVQCI